MGRLVVLLLTPIILTACGGSKTAAPKRCGLSLDGQMLLPGSVKRLDYSMRTRTINGRARVETWRVTGDKRTVVYYGYLGPPGGSPRLIWPAGYHVYAAGCSNDPHWLRASKITVG
jgi:hypothetical protein